MKYYPLGDELTFEHALIQASQALDLSARLAVQQKDSGGLLAVGETWVKLADFMMSVNEHQEKKSQGERKSDLPMGFQGRDESEIELAAEVIEHDITIEEDDDVRDE